MVEGVSKLLIHGFRYEIWDWLHPEPPGRSGPLTNIALSWMRITSRRGPSSARVSDGRRVLRQKQPVSRGDSPTEPRPGRRDQEFEPAWPPERPPRQRLCSHLLCRRSSRCAQLPAERRILSRSSPGKAHPGAHRPEQLRPRCRSRRGVPADTCRLARRPITHRGIGTRGRNCDRRRGPLQ